MLPFFLALSEVSAQKTYKVVCDRKDGLVKIVDGSNRSPDMIPIKGGFPFYQVAENWIKENYPGGKCDPAIVIIQNQTNADKMNQSSVANIRHPDTVKTKPSPTPVNKSGPKQTPSVSPVISYRNTSVLFSILFSNMGKVFGNDPPLMPGLSLGIEQLAGKKFYGGAGIHFNTLFGKTGKDTDVSSFYNISIPLFAGYRQDNGIFLWGVDLGIAANTKLKPLGGDNGLAGEVAADYSLNTLTRIKLGTAKAAIEFGVDVWLNDIFTSESGFQMTILSIGFRGSF